VSRPGLQFEARVLVPGSAEGIALRLDESLSFWGGYDPANGEIIDVHHPQYRARVRASILFIPESRGSAGTPAGIAESLRNGSGPAAIVLGEGDVNIAVGVLVANRLYGLAVPVLEWSAQRFDEISSGTRLSIDDGGFVSVVA
jgi:predicted aconitase with swiveling domain